MPVFVRYDFQCLCETESRFERPADRKEHIFQLFIEFRKALFLQIAQIQTRKRKTDRRRDQPDEYDFRRGWVRRGDAEHGNRKEGSETRYRQTQVEDFSGRHLDQDILVFHSCLFNISAFVASGGFRQKINDDECRESDRESGTRASQKRGIREKIDHIRHEFPPVSRILPSEKILRSRSSFARLMSSMNDGRFPVGPCRPIIFPSEPQPS